MLVRVVLIDLPSVHCALSSHRVQVGGDGDHLGAVEEDGTEHVLVAAEHEDRRAVTVDELLCTLSEVRDEFRNPQFVREVKL